MDNVPQSTVALDIFTGTFGQEIHSIFIGISKLKKNICDAPAKSGAMHPKLL
jgi:hypothetical protein